MSERTTLGAGWTSRIPSPSGTTFTFGLEDTLHLHSATSPSYPRLKRDTRALDLYQPRINVFFWYAITSLQLISQILLKTFHELFILLLARNPSNASKFHIGGGEHFSLNEEPFSIKILLLLALSIKADSFIRRFDYNPSHQFIYRALLHSNNIDRKLTANQTAKTSFKLRTVVDYFIAFFIPILLLLQVLTGLHFCRYFVVLLIILIYKDLQGLKRGNSLPHLPLTQRTLQLYGFNPPHLRNFSAIQYLLHNFLLHPPGMGNEGSAPSTGESTPVSEYPSMYSIHSRVRSSVESTRAASPMEPPEPDMSHLTAEEIAQIKQVMDRAKNLQEEESTRARQLEEDYIQLATQVERRSSDPSDQQVGVNGLPLCPVCNKTEIDVKAQAPMGQLPAVCVDCKKTTCPNCGAFAPPLPNKVQEWVCVVCNKRRQLMMTTGLWYHGCHGFQADDELPLTRSLTQEASTLVEKTDALLAPGMDSSMTSIVSDRSVASSRDSRGSKESREDSDSALDSGKHSGSGARCAPGVGGTDSGLGLDLVSSSLSGLSAASSSNSELAKHVYEQNKMKGPGATLPKSESDEFSDLTSDLDFDELASERSRPDGGSSTDENAREGMGTHERGNRRNKHRPRFLHLTRSHSHTSSDEEEDQDQERTTDDKDGGKTASEMDSSAKTKKSKTLVLPPNANSLAPQGNQSGKNHSSSSSSSSSSTSSSSASYTLPHGGPQTCPQEEHRVKSSVSPSQMAEISGDTAVNSPTPRSPSWREGLESPPFSPRPRDSYPGKRRGSLSPKDKKGGGSHFTYSDISPPSRQLSLDELYGGHTSGSALDNGVAGSHAPQRPSPMSPQEIKDAAMVTTSGHALVFDMPPAARNGKQSIQQQYQPQQGQGQVLYKYGGSGEPIHHDDDTDTSDEPMVTCGVPHSAPVMDLATFAATITSSTNTLTSLTAGSVSPNTQNNASPSTLSGSPEDSGDSSCSSPVSPGFYDNATPPSDEPEEVCELADPSSKTIDMQGSKRQKARPPSTDWSPVIDLSPILDVSPSVEEAEQEDMLAKRMEELERQRSREAEEDGDEEECEGEEKDKASLNPMQSGFSSKLRGKGGPVVAPLTLTNTELPEIPRIPPPPSAKKLKQQLNEELEESGGDRGKDTSLKNSYEEDDEEDEDDEREMDISSSFTYGSSLRRCGNFEDISRLSCDSSNILTSPMDCSTTDDGLYSSDVSQEFSFPYCTSQAETYSTISSMSTSTISSIGCTTSNSSSNSSSISSDRDIEMLDITDQIQRITQDMENIVKKGEVVDPRPVPPPKPKRRFPDTEVGYSPPPATEEKKDTINIRSNEGKASIATKEQGAKALGSKGSVLKGSNPKAFDIVGKKQSESCSKMTVPCIVMDNTPETGCAKDDIGHVVLRQDSSDKKKAKDLKAKPSPLLITHIECEEQSVSPHYRVMESPPTPETKTVKREFSDSTSVSPSSTPDQDVYAFPSPVTPPDSDSSPPKPHSPSSPGSDFDEEDMAVCRVFSPYDNSGLVKSSPQVQRKSGGSESVGLDTRASAGSPDGAPVPVRPPISPRKTIKRQEEARQSDSGPGSEVHGITRSPTYENIKGIGQHDFLQDQHKSAQDVTSAKGLEELGMTSLCAQYIGQRTQIFAYPAVRDPNAESSRVIEENLPPDDQQSPQHPRYQRPEVPPRPRPGTISNQPRQQQQAQQLKTQHHQQHQQPEQNENQHQRTQAPVVRQSSIKDKIKAFEEPPVPRKRFQKEATPPSQVEVANRRGSGGRREGHMMHDKRADSGSSSSSSGSISRTSSSDQSKSGETTGADGKKVRRKLPPIPAGEDPVLAPKSRVRRGKGEGEASRETPNNSGKRGASVSGAGAKQDAMGGSAEARSAALQGFIVGRSNRKTSPRRGEDMNEEDLEVARLTNRTTHSSGQRGTSSSAARLDSSDDSSATPAKLKGYLAETGKSRSLDSVDTAYSSRGGKADIISISTGSCDGGRVKPPLIKTASLRGPGPGPQCETDAMIDELIEIYGIPCTEAMKCLKQRLQEELRRVTRDRKRKLEELEEIRALQMQIGALKLESDALSRTRALVGRQIELDRTAASGASRHSRISGTSQGLPTSSSTPKSSPQVTPRRARHKRQSSDPMVSKFSPIKEDRDIEADLSSWGLHLETLPIHGSHKTTTYPSADESSQSGVSDSESTRSEPATRRHNRGRTKASNKVNDHSKRFLAPDLPTVGGSAETLSQYSNSLHHQVHQNHQPRHRQDPGAMHLSGSRSEQHLPSSSRRENVPHYTSHYSSDDDEEFKVREEKRALLQWEITRRRKQLEETARLKEELLKLARSRHGHAQSWDDLSRQELSHQYVAPTQLRPVPRGIITPIEDGGGAAVVPVRRRSRDPSRERSRSREASRERVMGIPDEIDHPYESPSRVASRGRASSAAASHVEDPYSYSSSEYLAHKQEAGRRYTRGGDSAIQYGSQGWIPGYGRDGPDLGAGQPAYSQPALNSRADSAVSLSGGAGSRREMVPQDAGGIVSSVTLPNIYSNRLERGRDFRQPYRDQTFASTSISDTDNSPASDVTPAMPLLGDVKIKSRAIIRNIGSGSRPVSAEFSAGEVEDLLNAMYRVESDNSVDADEPIMKHMTEGGVTILKQIERKRRPAPVEPHRYEFPVKRILVTRDPKDKSITGNGLGMKIMGGKEIQGTGEIGAFVTAIYPILADQLHGELDIGDQVLEWNGVYLTGLSAQDVQDIIGSTVGEIEMVVRAQTVPLSSHGLSLQADSCRSSYDNLGPPVYEEAVKEPPPETRRGSTPPPHGTQAGRTARRVEKKKEEEEEKREEGAAHLPSRSSAQTSRPGRRQARTGVREVVELSPEPPMKTSEELVISNNNNNNNSNNNHNNSNSYPSQARRQTPPTGVDPRVLAAQLEEIPGAAWPADTANQSPGSSSSHKDQIIHISSSPTSSSSYQHSRNHHQSNHQKQHQTYHHRQHHHHQQHQSNNSSSNSHRERGHEDLVSPVDSSSHLDDNHSISSSQRDVSHSPDTYHRDDLASPPCTPPGSSPCSTPRSDPTSTSSDRQQRRQDRNIDNLGPDNSPSRRRRRPSPQLDKAQATSQRHQHHHHHHQHQHQPAQKRQQHQQQSSHQRHQHHHQHHQSDQQQIPHEDGLGRSPSPSKQHSSSRRSSANEQQHHQNMKQQQQQQQQQEQDLDLPPQPDRAPPNRKRTVRKKSSGTPSVSTPQSVTDKPRPSATIDQLEQASCSSPALNDRLRASPPLDTRRSIKTRASKRGKDNFVVPVKITQPVEKGEDFGHGEIRLQISHDDFDNTLNIHVIQARNLRPRDLNGLSDPFVKLYMLPGRGPENKRRTKHIPRTLNPEWHQTVMFQDVARLELQNKVLEITVWDYDRFKANDFLGELIIELREFAFLDNKPHWYPLKEHVTMQSFELPKSTVSPPKPSEKSGAKSKSPRQGKKHGVSSLRSQDSKENGGEVGKRRRSLGTLTGNGHTESSTERQVSSAHNSPVPPRRPRDSKSPIKTKSNGLLYR